MVCLESMLFFMKRNGCSCPTNYKKDDRCLVVNATALDSSGALGILRQFLANIPDTGHNWLIFVSDQIAVQSPLSSVRIVPIPRVKPMYKRFLWDAFGLNRWLKKNGIEPLAAISLQNTGFRISQKVPRYIYYHQPLPFYPYVWNPLKKKERTLWFYKHIYPFFVKLFLTKDTTVFVQLDFIKDGFVRIFRHPFRNVHVYSPSVVQPDLSGERMDLLPGRVALFYPATSVFYKNHDILKEALRYTCGNVQLYFTLDNPTGGSDERITYMGTLPYPEVCAMYRTCDALVFPSYIETFGLPLIEAAMAGLPILVADLPYAREVLAGYEGAIFVPYNDAKAWAMAMDGLEKDKRYRPLDISNRPGWKELFNKIISTI